MNVRAKYEKIERMKKYTIDEVAELMEMDIQTVIEWRTLGALNHERDRVYKLNCHSDGERYYVFGKDLAQFLYDINL